MLKAIRWLPAALLTLLAGFSYSQGLDSAAARVADHNAKLYLDAHPGLRQSATRVLVRFRTGTTLNAEAAARGQISATLVHRYSLVQRLEVIDSPQGAAAAITALRHNPHVQYAEFDNVVHTQSTPSDTWFAKQWGLGNQNMFGINAAPAWDIFTGDPNFVIADIDSGMQLDHLDLAPNLYHNTAEIAGNGIDDDGDGYVDDVDGWNFYDNNNDPSDVLGHGTHTAGIMGAVGNNALGIAGVNWACKIMPLKFVGANGGYDSDAIRALEYAVSKGVKVSNNSWGETTYSQALYDAINAAQTSGHLFVAAAGNNSANSDTSPMYPAAFNLDNIISVAATDNTGNLAYFSNYGPTTVDIAAPGDTIYSTYTGSSLAYMSGTSMAAPHVTGVAALVWGYHPDWTWQQVKSRILAKARPMSTLTGKCVTGGIVDAYSVLTDNPLPPGIAITAPTTNSVYTQGTSITFTGTASDGLDGDISSKIVWSSNVQGTLGVGASLTTTSLLSGFQTITATVTDSRGLSVSQSIALTIRNTAPVITITSPTAGASFAPGKSVSFTGTASDQQDGDLTYKMIWTSNLQGQIGKGGSFSRSDLVAGTHTITVSVVDSGNLQTNSTFSITIGTSNAPTVTITTPTAGATDPGGTTVAFSGSASDTVDGNLSAKMSWSSSLQGQIGTGSSFSRSDLVVGTHTITASVTDSTGLTTTTTITLVIQDPNSTPPAAPSAVSVVKFYSGVNVKWTDNSGNESGFTIQREKKMGSSWSAPVSVGNTGPNATSFADNPGSGTWRYSVRSFNSAGTSTWSAWTSAIKI